MSVENNPSSRLPETVRVIHSPDRLSRLLSSLAELAGQLRQLHAAGEFHGDIGTRGRYAASGTGDKRLQIWKLPELPLPEGQIGLFESSKGTGVVRVSPDSTAVAAGGENGIRCWELETNEKYSDYTIKSDSLVTAMKFTRDGHDETVRVWNLNGTNKMYDASHEHRTNSGDTP